MTEKKQQKKWFPLSLEQWEEVLMKAFIFTTLFFPLYYSKPQQQPYFYPEISLPYCILTLYLIVVILKRPKLQQKKFGLLFGGLLLIYNVVFLYYNHKYQHWYWEQINNTIAFLFFLSLCIRTGSTDLKIKRIIPFLLGCVLISNALGIVCYLFGYTQAFFCNGVQLLRLPEDFYEERFSWIYSHKSEYGLMLAGFFALVLRYRQTFRSKITFAGGLLILAVALWFTHSWTSVGACAVVVFGAVLDAIPWKQFKLRWFHVAGAGAALAAGALLAKKILGERDLSSLGSRLPIWKQFAGIISRHPEGIGVEFNHYFIKVTDTWAVNNFHNVFLNVIFRFSVPVGILFILLVLFVIGYSLWKAKSFLSVGTWIALLMILNMDYSLLNYEIAMFLFLIYMIMIYQEPAPVKGAVKRQDKK